MRREGTSIQRHEEKSAPACRRERASELALAPLFICLSLPGPVLCKLGQPGVLFVLPEVLTPVLGPWTFFCCIFAGFSLPCLLATTILDSFSLFYLPNRTNNPPPTSRVWEKSNHLPESFSLASTLAKQCMHHQEGL